VTSENEEGATRGDLSEQERAELERIRAQMEDTSTYLDGLLRGWNHGSKEEYRRMEEVAKAVATARDAAREIA